VLTPLNGEQNCELISVGPNLWAMRKLRSSFLAGADVFGSGITLGIKPIISRKVVGRAVDLIRYRRVADV